MINLNERRDEEGFLKWKRRERNGRIAAGLMVIVAGVFYLLHLMEVSVSDWLFSWPMIIIGIAIISGIKEGWNNWKWFVIFIIGLLFLGAHIYPDSVVLQYKIPIVLFIIGLVIIFKPKSEKHQYHKYRMKEMKCGDMKGNGKVEEIQDDYIHVNNIFSGTEKVVFSKDFKGGDIKMTFGGCEINLMQADIREEAVIIVNQQFSGVKLTVPSNWVIKSDLNCVFAGIEDKRQGPDVTQQGNEKTLILKGNLFMAGLEIVSY